ncbi:DegV family protein [Candidatus Villigracilis affinis]|uniref:DegV family protein n=1 Tax=Candidatus Villigracilis affinis TaxID=3140682 RepID=UPI002A1C6A38|nr:DegV family protein [Anaerolineales bacterium]
MTIIVADTTCGLPRAMLEARGIPLIPQVVTFGEESFHDSQEMDTAMFLQRLKASSVLPKTAAPEPSLYVPIFKQAQENGESVIVVAPTGKASGTVRSAETAAQDFAGVDIHVVDTQTISCNLGSLVLLADDMAKAGESASEIVAKLNDLIPRGRLYFLVDTLEYLAKGGRIGGAKRLLAELLEIKPILQVKNGQVESFEQQRTKKRALARLVEVVAEQCPGGDSAHLCVIQVEAENEAQVLVAELKSRVSVSQIPIYELPPAIVVHAGPRAMGVGFFA